MLREAHSAVRLLAKMACHMPALESLELARGLTYSPYITGGRGVMPWMLVMLWHSVIMMMMGGRNELAAR